MTTPRGFRDRADDGLLTLLGEVPELVRNLVVAEVDSAKKWAASAGKDVGMGGIWFIVALFFLFWSLPALGAFAIIGLSSWIPAWVASLIVLLVGLLAVVVFALMGLRRFRHLRRSEGPKKALATDTRIVKDVLDEF